MLVSSRAANSNVAANVSSLLITVRYTHKRCHINETWCQKWDSNPRNGKSSADGKEDSGTRRPLPATDGLSCNTCTSNTDTPFSINHGTPDPNSDPNTEEKSSSQWPTKKEVQQNDKYAKVVNYRAYYDRRHGARRLPELQPGEKVLIKREYEKQ